MRGVTAVLERPGVVGLREYDLPDVAPGGVLLNMIRANVCGSEVHVVKGHHPLIGPGCSIGHEGVGRVERLGEGVERDFAGQPLHEGDRVVVTYFQTCRRCGPCNRGQGFLCENAYARWRLPADTGDHFYGTFGTHWAVSGDQYLYKVPDSVSSRAVSAANCALSQMVSAIERGDVRRGDRVLLLGAGGLGLCGAALASEAGAEVFVAEMAASRLEKAKEFGAHVTIDQSPAEDSTGRIELVKSALGGQGADVVIDLTGVPSAFAEGVAMVRPGGTFVSVGNISPNRFTEFDPGAFTRSGASMRAVIRYPAHFLFQSVQFIERTPHFPWESLVDKDYELSDVTDAIAAAEARSVTRAGLVVEGSSL